MGEKRVRTGTTTSVNMAHANPLYYTDVPSPQLETLHASTAQPFHVNKVMALDGDFISGIGDGMLPGRLGRDFGLFGKPALLYRECTQRLVAQLLGTSDKAPGRATVLAGMNGAGKSAELLKLASVAASSGFLVIYAPSTIGWVDSSRPYEASGKSRLFQQPELTVELLRSTLAWSPAALRAVPLGTEFAVSKKRSLGGDKTLFDLVMAGINTPSLAHSVLERLLSTAKTQTRVPVLVAVDDVNSLWCTTQYRDQNDRVLAAKRLRLVRALRPFFDGRRALGRGWVVGAVSYADMRYMSKEMDTMLNPPPAVPLANPELSSGAKAPGSNELPFDVVRMGGMSAVEAWALMHFYHETRLIAAPVTKALAAKRWTVAGGNPRRMFTGVTSFF
ncbi:hypothetical protein IWW50_003862 [Coemansia erecta]|nr:hypothetical protein IWW50_003862 [Coemansia erecta]